MARLIVGVELKMAVAVFDRPLRTVGIRRGERRPDVLEADAVAEQGGGIQLHADRGQCGSADRDLADAVELRQALLQHVARGIIELPARQRLRGEGENHQGRIRGIHLAVCGIAGEAGRDVGGRGIDRRLDIAGCAIDVAVQIELQRDARLPGAALRRDLGDVGDSAEIAFQRLRHAGGDGFRVGAGQRGGN